METMVLAAATLVSLAGIGALSIQSRRAAARLERIDARRLDEVVKEVERIRHTCLGSLENMQRSLDALRSRAEAAEQKLAGGPEEPHVGLKGFYEAAALLLEAGQSVERVAAMIGLPAGHVMLVQELRRVLVKEPAPQRTAKRGDAAATESAPRKKKRGRLEQKKVQPILLTDAVGFDGALDGRNGHQPGDHGAAA